MKKRHILALFVCVALSLTAQQAPPVNQSIGSPPFAVQSIYDYAGGANLVYVGSAMSDQGRDQIMTVSAASNANPVSFTATAHGFDYQSAATTTPVVCISGATLNWTPINGCFAATPTSANAFTIAVDSTTFGALTGTLVVTTRAPLTTSPVWAISKNVYTGTTIIWSGWAALPSGAGVGPSSAGSTANRYIWDNRTTLAYQ